MPVLFAMRAAMIAPARRQLRALAAVRCPQPAMRDKREALMTVRRKLSPRLVGRHPRWIGQLSRSALFGAVPSTVTPSSASARNRFLRRSLTSISTNAHSRSSLARSPE